MCDSLAAVGSPPVVAFGWSKPLAWPRYCKAASARWYTSGGEKVKTAGMLKIGEHEKNETERLEWDTGGGRVRASSHHEGGPTGQANRGLALLSGTLSYILVVFEVFRLSNIAEGMGETLCVAEHPGNRSAGLPYLGTEGTTLHGEPLAI